jgi:hypothetical protein
VPVRKDSMTGEIPCLKVRRSARVKERCYRAPRRHQEHRPSEG